MRLRELTWMMLAGLLLVGTGASIEGVERAREWQWNGDVISAGGMWEYAYLYYRRNAETFSDTEHGKVSRARARTARHRALTPEHSPAIETPASWWQEMLDFITWP